MLVEEDGMENWGWRTGGAIHGQSQARLATLCTRNGQVVQIDVDRKKDTLLVAHQFIKQLLG